VHERARIGVSAGARVAQVQGRVMICSRSGARVSSAVRALAIFETWIDGLPESVKLIDSKPSCRSYRPGFRPLAGLREVADARSSVTIVADGQPACRALVRIHLPWGSARSLRPTVSRV